MISKIRADEIKQAWLKYRRFDQQHSNYQHETECFMQGMRAALGEVLRLRTILRRSKHKETHLETYAPNWDEDSSPWK